MAQQHTREGRFRTRSGGIFMGATVVAFVLSPLLSLANTFGLLLGGLTLAVGMFALWDRAVLNDDRSTTERTAMVGILGGGVLLCFVFAQAAGVSNERATICAKLQDAMLNGDARAAVPVDGRAAPHDAFTALGCEFQSQKLFGVFRLS